MTKRQRTDTVKGALIAMKGATQGIPVPEHINVPEAAMPFWASITKTRALERWTDPDLEQAAVLARTKLDIEILTAELAEEGHVIKNDRGTPIANPKHNILETMTRRVVALSRALQIHAEATQGKSRDQVKSNKAQAEAIKATSTLNTDLLPGVAH